MNKPSLEQFLKDVSNHELTINLDQGLYRDLTIRKSNDSSDMHYHITTRPGYLIFTGDMGSFVFQRLDDMFRFFRDRDGYEINLGYWEEKLEATDSRGGEKKFSSDIAKQILQDHLKDYLENINESSSTNTSETATEAIQNLIELADSDEHEFYSELQSWDAKSNGGIDLDCWWEWDFKDYTFHYIWCCYAIVHAIKLYDAQNLKEEKEEG